MGMHKYHPLGDKYCYEETVNVTRKSRLEKETN